MQLIINFDEAHDEDLVCMTVVKKAHTPDQFIVLNQFLGQEANEIFEKLTGGKILFGSKRAKLLDELMNS